MVLGENEILLTKCCPKNFHMKTTCVINTIGNKNFSDVPVYSMSNDGVKFQVKQKFDNLFRVVANASITPGKEIINADLYFNGFIYNYDDFKEPSSFCLDYKENGNSTGIGFWLINDGTETKTKLVNNVEESYINITALLTSCVFLSLTILVYALLPKLRNMKGKILLSCVISLFGAFLALAILKIVKLLGAILLPSLCYSLISLFYFFFLSSFCWMNALSFMMWRDYRRMFERTPRIDNREIVNRRYRKYLVYAWGVPLILTILLNVLDQSGLKRYSWFMLPNIEKYGCFLGGYERLLYLDLPMMVLLIGNWYFFIITAYNIWATFKETKILNESALSLKKLLLVYVRLSILLGISWVLEIIAHAFPPSRMHPFWIMVDLYNGFIGLAFFLVLVCKKKIWNSLRRLKWQHKGANKTSYWSRT
ncbi:G-protein coupled receptor Mth2-like isoform X2 [Pieris rapae]|uniref:G-protein coupled receptor Mth2-like isoform X2 n=1 Tax=Pieris rapae TaxID=64459 RepID=UPI001E27B339|nr:G-protein coupled receptor Mth2-like isoform X2 [Pieris rapae]